MLLDLKPILVTPGASPVSYTHLCWPKLFLCLLPLAAAACFFAAPDNAGDHEEQDHCGNCLLYTSYRIAVMLQ